MWSHTEKLGREYELRMGNVWDWLNNLAPDLVSLHVPPLRKQHVMQSEDSKHAITFRLACNFGRCSWLPPAKFWTRFYPL